MTLSYCVIISFLSDLTSKCYSSSNISCKSGFGDQKQLLFGTVLSGQYYILGTEGFF